MSFDEERTGGMNPGTQEGAGEGMREAGGPRECWVRWNKEHGFVYEADHVKPHESNMTGIGWEWVRMVEAAPAPQGLREAAAEFEAAIIHEVDMGYMHALTAPEYLAAQERLTKARAALYALGAASASVSPKGEPSNPSISSNGSPSSPEIPDNPLNEGNSASTGSL